MAVTTATATSGAASSNLIWFARLGAISYIIWGCLHLQASYTVYRLGATLDPGMAQGRIYQLAFTLLGFATIGIIGAVTLIWRNSRWGYWIVLGAIALADTGFILFVLAPGYIPFWPGVAGPIFWILGWALTSVAYREAHD